jgi:phage terminase Nu1 subunit (DNA packaging protein)
MNIVDLVKTKGPSVLGPLVSTGNVMVYYAAFDGCPVLKNGKFGPESSFDSEEAAFSFAKRYAKEVHGIES